MGHVDGFPDKDGIDKLVKLGKAMCALVVTFTPIIIKKYPDNETIIGLLAAIAVVCGLLPDVEAEFLIETGDNSDPLADPDSTAGVNPSLPPASAPDIT
jgi:hypothetical protein